MATTPLKRILVGRPLASYKAEHQLLPKFLALPVFSSDALSSNAYATEEMMLVLVAAGAGALAFRIPIAIAIATVLVIVVVSYRQTVRAYPGGGGSYIVAHDNLGTLPGLVAAAALLADYVLTVAVLGRRRIPGDHLGRALTRQTQGRVVDRPGGAADTREPPRREGGGTVRRADLRIRRDGRTSCSASASSDA